ncbi:uncharacterized protein [Chelonus insularis]|uniref:uncharacterized protein isoform X2 n=1 Tax=Chelonus insularis TaxID=460826 RepID=UPI00158AE005|nr:uncharacterized protein LOC118066718 isoform X2 [Chelonus insularis]
MVNDQQLVIIEEQLTEEQLNNPIYQLIKDTTDGKTIVKYYLTHNHVEKNLRNLLTRIILRAEANKIFGPVDINNEPKSLPKFRITVTRFKELANQIVNLFPCENVLTYYSPYVEVNKRRINSSGTMWDHYNYLKKKFRAGKILDARNILEEEPDYAANETEVNQLEWLKDHLDPKDVVLQYWNNTYDLRHAKLKAGLSVSEYFSNIPALGVAQGIQLIQADFKHIYSENLFNQNRWRIIKNYLMNRLMNGSFIKTLQDEALLLLLPTLLAHNQDAVILYLLPNLIQGGTKKKQMIKTK